MSTFVSFTILLLFINDLDKLLWQYLDFSNNQTFSCLLPFPSEMTSVCWKKFSKFHEIFLMHYELRNTRALLDVYTPVALYKALGRAYTSA